MSQDIIQLLQDHQGRQFELHEKHVNPQMRRMLHLVEMDVDYVRSAGNYLYDSKGRQYLDLMTHSGVFSVGHNHPHVAEFLKAVLSRELPHLLLMDCSLLSGLLAERLLKRAPHLGKVYFGNSGAEAIEVCERGQCDITLLDVMMPGMDGFEVAARLKSNPATHHIPIIMVTALDQPSDKVQGLEAGAV